MRAEPLHPNDDATSRIRFDPREPVVPQRLVCPGLVPPSCLDYPSGQRTHPAEPGRCNPIGRPLLRHTGDSVMAVTKVRDLAYGRLRAPDLDAEEEFLVA